MANDKMTEIQLILGDVDERLHERLSAISVEIPYLILAVGPDGKALVRGNIDPEGLKQLVKEIEQAAREVATDDEPLH